jgi:hypothetical protein
MSRHPRLSVVIPTCDRGRTLRYALQTVLDQEYDNLQVIVSDNASRDDTQDIVANFRDSRIRYLRTPRRVSMSSNWEHGLAAVDGEYVHFLGDDDGLLPGTCGHVAATLERHPVPAIAWRKAEYLWPDAPVQPDQLTVPTGNQAFLMPSRFMLRLIASGRAGYGRLPNLYTSFVATSVLRGVQGHAKTFFRSVTPDVYSGIVVAGAVTEYLYLTRPLSVNGGSGKSNGLSIYSERASEANNAQFLKDNEIPVHRLMPLITGSIVSSVGEAFLQAQDLGLTAGIRLHLARYRNKIIQDIRAMANRQIQRAAIESFVRVYGESPPQFSLLDHRDEDRAPERGGAGVPLLHQPVFDRDMLRIDLSRLGVRDVNGAATVVAACLDPSFPDQVRRLGPTGLALNWIVGPWLQRFQRRHFPRP